MTTCFYLMQLISRQSVWLKLFVRWVLVIGTIGCTILCQSCSWHRLPSTTSLKPPFSVSYIRSTFSDLPDWSTTSLNTTLTSFLQSCQRLERMPYWQPLCQMAKQLPSDPKEQRQFFESQFVPWQLAEVTTKTGRITGYYEPILRGQRQPSSQTPYPVYGLPSDMKIVPYPAPLHISSVLSVNQTTAGKILASSRAKNPLNSQSWVLYPNKFWKDYRTVQLVARIEGKELLPYYTREQIQQGKLSNRAPILAWLENWVDLAYLQIQGSGRIQLEDGSTLRLGYAAQNGHPFVSVAKWLIQQHHLTPSQVSPSGIKHWIAQHPTYLNQLIKVNPNYIFFKLLDQRLTDSPIGALGVRLTAGYSAAIDTSYIPLGAPLYIATTHPTTHLPLHRLIMAQDKGSAIQGPLRIDLFWGSGKEAGFYAQRCNAPVRVWLFLPKTITPNSIPSSHP